MKNLKFFIKTLGCKANQLESAVMTEKLTGAGYTQVRNVENSDIFILNSCSVTENADIETQRILRHAKKQKPEIITVFTGCSAQLTGNIADKPEYIDIIAGNDDKFEIVELLETKTSRVKDIFTVKKFNNRFVYNYKKTRGYLKIQDGCNNYCSYCTIPLARGISRSNSVENIIKQLEIYIENGLKEVVLTGIHIGQWGEDRGLCLKNLLEEIEKTDISRYRLGSLNPLEITDELLEFLAHSKKFCPHFHLSLQSVNTKILEAMNREYSAENCTDLLNKINTVFKNPFTGTDIIVGFPGETDEDFLVTFENLKKMELSNIHVFPYSLRKNTKAALLSGHVEMNEKKKRADILHKLAKQKFDTFAEKNIGQTAEVLVEKNPDRKTGLLKGVTKNYLNVYLECTDKTLCNTIQKVRIVKFEAGKLFCNIIEG